MKLFDPFHNLNPIERFFILLHLINTIVLLLNAILINRIFKLFLTLDYVPEEVNDLKYLVNTIYFVDAFVDLSIDFLYSLLLLIYLLFGVINIQQYTYQLLLLVLVLLILIFHIVIFSQQQIGFYIFIVQYFVLQIATVIVTVVL